MAKMRKRRQFDAAFKLEAVRRMQERLALKISLADNSRDLDAQPDQLRSRARQLAKRVGHSSRV